MKIFVPVFLLGLFALAPSNARAEAIVFDTTFTTSGSFRCIWTHCTGGGTSAITLGSGDSTATITFVGTTKTFEVTNQLTPVTLGEFTMSATPGFTFPLNEANPRLPILGFVLTMTQTSPVQGTVNKFYAFGPGGGTNLRLQESIGNWITFGTGNPRYPQIVYTLRPYPFTIPAALTANVAAVPEPATLVLLGAGLAGGALARRRQSVRSRQRP